MTTSNALTIENVKSQSHKLKSHLSSKGIDLTHMACLEAISAMNGHNSWQHFSAYLKKQQSIDNPLNLTEWMEELELSNQVVQFNNYLKENNTFHDKSRVKNILEGLMEYPLIRKSIFLHSDKINIIPTNSRFVIFLKVNSRSRDRQYNLPILEGDMNEYSKISDEIKELANLTEEYKTQDGRIVLNLVGHNLWYDVSATPTVNGYAFTIKLERY